MILALSFVNNILQETLRISSAIGSLYTVIFLFIITVFWLFVLLTNRRRIVNSIADVVGENRKFYRKRLNTYVQHQMTDHSQNGVNITIKDLLKSLRGNIDNSKLYFIVGESGYGKTILIEWIIYKILHFRKLKLSNLRDRGILYLKLGNFSTINNLVDEINRHSDINFLFLDGFDEYKGLRSEDPKNILDEIIDCLRRMSYSYKGIVIGTRIEPIKGGIDFLNQYKVAGNTISHNNTGVRVIQIQPFTKKQILKLYQKIGGSISGEIIRGKYPQKMSEYLRNTNDPIFSIPFLLNYADDIFEMNTAEELSNRSITQIYHNLVELWIRREYQIYANINANAQTLSLENYTSKAFEVLNLIIEKMIVNDMRIVTYEELKILLQPLSDYIDFNNIITRHLLHQNKRGEYSFIHSSFYKYFLANSFHMLSFNAKRRALQDVTNADLDKFYGERLYNDRTLHNEIVKSIEQYVFNGQVNSALMNEKDFIGLVKAETIKVKNNPDLTVKEVIELFPLASSIEFRQYNLDANNIDEWMNNKELDLSNQKLSSLDGLSLFGEFDDLDISNNLFTDFHWTKEIDGKKIGTINANMNHFTDFSLIKNVITNTIWVDLNCKDDAIHLFNNSSISNCLVNLEINVDLLEFIRDKIDEDKIRIIDRYFADSKVNHSQNTKSISLYKKINHEQIRLAKELLASVQLPEKFEHYIKEEKGLFVLYELLQASFFEDTDTKYIAILWANKIFYRLLFTCEIWTLNPNKIDLLHRIALALYYAIDHYELKDNNQIKLSAISIVLSLYNFGMCLEISGEYKTAEIHYKNLLAKIRSSSSTQMNKVLYAMALRRYSYLICLRQDRSDEDKEKLLSSTVESIETAHGENDYITWIAKIEYADFLIKTNAVDKIEKAKLMLNNFSGLIKQPLEIVIPLHEQKYIQTFKRQMSTEEIATIEEYIKIRLDVIKDRKLRYDYYLGKGEEVIFTGWYISGFLWKTYHTHRIVYKCDSSTKEKVEFDPSKDHLFQWQSI